VCRAYGLPVDQVESMDFLAYLIAIKDLADCPIVDESLLMMFGGKNNREMTVSERRAKRKRAR
jgi:hypothetical protein